VIDGLRLQLADIVEMPQVTSSEKRTFICIEVIDECVPGNQVKPFGSLDQVLRNSPRTRIFVTARPEIGPEIGRCLAGKVSSRSLSSKRHDITRCLYTRPNEDTGLDEMNGIDKGRDSDDNSR